MKKSLPGKRMAKAITLLFIGFLTVVSVQYVMNYLVYKKGPELPSAVRVSFHYGKADGGHIDDNKILGSMGFSPFEDLKGSVSTFISRPKEVIGLISSGFYKRLLILYFFPNFGTFDPILLVNPGCGFFFRFSAYLQFYSYILIVVGAIAAFLRRKANTAGAVLLLSFVAYVSIRIALFYVLNARYRGVMMPIFILFFAYGLEVFCIKVKEAYGKGALKHGKS